VLARHALIAAGFFFYGCTRYAGNTETNEAGQPPAVTADSVDVGSPPPSPAAQERSAAQLIEAFESAEGFVAQGKTAEELVTRGDRSVIPAIEKYLDSESRLERCNAGLVLAGLGDERGLAAIIAELRDKGPRPVRPGQVATSKSSQTAQDRYYAAQTLGALGDKRAVPVLMEHLRDEEIHYTAATALGKIGDRSAVPALKGMLNHENPDGRMWAAFGLAELGDPAGISALADILLEAPSWIRRRHAADALGRFGDSRAVPVLLRAIGDESPDVVVVAIHALGKLGDKSALPRLEELLGDGRRSTSWRVVTVGQATREAIRLIQSKQQGAAP